MTGNPSARSAIADRPTTSGARLHHLDALRGGALLLGVLLHALMPFLPGDVWLVNDSRDSVPAALGMGVIHLFRMTLFMMLAGYFGHMVLNRRGTGAYLRDRLLRIGLPMVAFWPPLFAMIALAIVSFIALGGSVPESRPDVEETGSGVLALPTMHLWFLLLLMEIVLVVILLRAVLVRALGPERSRRISRRIGALAAAPAGILLVAVPYALGAFLQPGAVTGLNEPTTLVPVVGASIAYGGAFLTGWFLRAEGSALARVERRWIIHLVGAVVLTPAAMLSPAFAPPLLGAALTGLAGWAWVFGLLGLMARLVRREIPWVRYLADASYWIYLLHLPLLLWVEIPIAGWDAPVLVKLALVLTVATAVLLLSYDLLVRSTWIGAWLNGRRHPRALSRRSQPLTAPAAAKP